jgi:hypothetical protein
VGGGFSCASSTARQWRSRSPASAGGAIPDWYEPVNAWTGAMWSAAALTGALAMIGYGVATIAGQV